jgi:arylsulfatase A-like enzyme
VEDKSSTQSIPTENGGAKQPNVLFVICDQLRADHLGFAGNPIVQTPNIDRIAAGGTIFDRAYVNNPVCMPNRSTLMTGRMPSAHGVVFNDRALDPNVNTFVAQLRDAGWRTALIGKSHLQHGESRAAVADYGQTPGVFSPFEEGWDTIEHQERYEVDDLVDPDDYYGFGHIELAVGHGAFAGGHHYRWARQKGVSKELLRAGLDPTFEIEGRSADWWQIHPTPYPEEASSTTFVTERTIDFIEQADADGAPWMTWCSFPDPHHPLAAPDRWLRRHDPDDIPLPETFDDPGDHWPPHLTRTRSNDAPDHGGGLYVIPFGPTPEQARAAIAATYGMIEAIDDGVGKILATLDRLDAVHDTIIIFTSDHGDMMGDHGLLLKGTLHFEGCLRVPMVVNVPDGAGQRTSSMAASIDLPHTVLDLCGVREFQGMQGASLAPVLADPTVSVRDNVLVEDDMPLALFIPDQPLKTRTIVTAGGRFTRDSNGNEMLFDLHADPDELHNLTRLDPGSSLRTDMLQLFVDSMMNANDLTRTEPVSP